MKKALYIIITVVVMLIVSRGLIRFLDATTQIGDYLWLLLAVLILINVAIGYLSYRLYRYRKKD